MSRWWGALVVVVALGGVANAFPIWKITAPLDGYADVSEAARAQAGAALTQEMEAAHGEVTITAYAKDAVQLSIVQTSFHQTRGPKPLADFEAGTTESLGQLGTQVSLTRSKGDKLSIIDQEFQRDGTTILVHRVVGFDPIDLVGILAICTGDKPTCSGLISSITIDESGFEPFVAPPPPLSDHERDMKHPEYAIAYWVTRIGLPLIVLGLIYAFAIRPYLKKPTRP